MFINTSGFYVYISVFSAQFCLLIGGTCLAWSSPMLSKLDGLEDNPLGRIITSTENSWLASLPTLGACLGSVLYGVLASRFGRKTLLISLGFPFLICYLLLAWARTIWLFYVCRFLPGVALGGAVLILPMYSGELADVKNRGSLGTSISIFLNMGLLFVYSIGPFISFFWFHIVLAILPAIYIISFSIYAPESPRYLLQTDSAKAERVLKKLRGREDVIDELKEMKDNMDKESEGSLTDIFRSKGLKKAFFVGLGGITFMELAGMDIVITYSQSIFESSGSEISPELCSIVVGIAQVVPPIFTSTLADKFRRKLLLIVSHFGVSLMGIILGVYFYLKDSGIDVTAITFLPLTTLILYVLFFKFGVEPIILTFLGELFPMRVKGIAISCLLVYMWICVFLIVVLFNTLRDNLGMSCLFWIFSACGFLAIIFVKFFVIETKGKSLETIQVELNEKKTKKSNNAESQESVS